MSQRSNIRLGTGIFHERHTSVDTHLLTNATQPAGTSSTFRQRGRAIHRECVRLVDPVNPQVAAVLLLNQPAG